MKERLIMHADINHCYAQIEEMMDPQLKKIPMAVGGSEESRHGIILAKNLHAKKYNIKTGEPIRDSLKKCPQLMIIHPRMKFYKMITEKVKDIYREYSDKVESFGLDEAWVDLTGSQLLFGDGFELAAKIQKRVYEEMGLTISVGVSFNKVFAKVASDMVKPSGLIHITRDTYQDTLWKLPVEDLLMVGWSTRDKLNRLGIVSIGDLAQYPLDRIEKRLGKNGRMIWEFANGMDHNSITASGYKRPPKSIGNSWTTPKDVCTLQDAKIVMTVIGESVASRMREQGLQASVISIHVRNIELKVKGKQRKLKIGTDVSSEIIKVSMDLLQEIYDFSIPIRSMGITVSDFTREVPHLQASLLEPEAFQQLEDDRILDVTMDKIRQRYGFGSIKRASVLVDEDLSDFNPKGDHIAFPAGFVKDS